MPEHKDQTTSEDERKNENIVQGKNWLPHEKKAYDLMFGKHYVLTATVFGYVVGNLFVFVGLGYLGDMYLGTKPILIALGFVASFLSTQYCLYRKFRNLEN